MHCFETPEILLNIRDSAINLEGGLLRRKDVQGTRYELRQKGGDWLEGDRKIWKEVQPSADVQTLATVLLISSDVCQGTKAGQ